MSAVNGLALTAIADRHADVLTVAEDRLLREAARALDRGNADTELLTRVLQSPVHVWVEYQPDSYGGPFPTIIGHVGEAFGIDADNTGARGALRDAFARAQDKAKETAR